MMLRIYCYKCNNFHTADVETDCPYCGAVGDDLIAIDDDNEVEEDDDIEERDYFFKD